jgi:hypothetical protein
MLSRLADLRTNMFDDYVETLKASSSTVLVQRWRLTDGNTRQQPRNDCVTTNEQPKMAAIRAW